MGRPLQLEDFGSVRRQLSEPPEDGMVTEERRLAAFEEGYSAGWDDASARLSEAHQKFAADLAGNLADLSFTFHEARSHVLQGVEPLIRQLVESLLPKVARTALPHLVFERLSELIQEAVSAPIVIVTAPSSRAEIETILPADPGFPITMREEATLADGQVFIRTGDIEHEIDTGAALNGLAKAVDDFFNLNEHRQKAHG